MTFTLYLLNLTPRSYICSKFTAMFMFLIFFIAFGTCKNLKSPSTAIPGSPTYIASQSSNSELSNTTQIFNVTLQEFEYLSEQAANVLLAKNSFCMCQCCSQKLKLNKPDTCRGRVREALPENFECPKNLCSKFLRSNCSAWKKNRCEKACFCQKCKYKLKPDDGRCSGDLEPATGCQCPKHESYEEKCLPQQEGIATVWLMLLKAKNNKKYLRCTMGCYCKNCNRLTLAKVFNTNSITQTCKAYQTIPSHCKTCPTCPNVAAVNHAKQTLEQLAILHGSHSS